MVFDYCTFDLTSSVNGLKMFDFSSSLTNVVANLSFRACDIRATDISLCSLYVIGGEDTVVLKKGGDGSYGTLTQLTSSAAPTMTFVNEQGLTISFGKDGTSGVNTIYVLGEPIKTPYGYIPFMYQSAELYPFVAFDGEGNFINVSSTFFGPNSSTSIFNYAKTYLAANSWNGTSYGDNARTVVIYMRRDYAMDSAERFDNVAQVQGLLTVDLGGFTMTAPQDRVMIPAVAKPWSGSGDAAVFPSVFLFKNGSVVLKNRPLFQLESWGGSSNLDVSGKIFSFTFENIDFSVVGSTANFLANYTVNSGTPDSVANPDVNFINCRIDLTGGISDMTLFNLGSKNINTAVTVKGGSIIINDALTKLYSKSADTEGYLVFGRDDSGSYTLLELSQQITPSAEKYDLQDGRSAAFVKLDERDDVAIYVLKPSVDYVPSTNLTLDRDLILNVYLPLEGLVSFTLDGVEYTDLAALSDTKVTVDDREHYLVSIPLPASGAARRIPLCAKVNLGGDSFEVSFELSVLGYAKRLISTGTDVEVKLMKDILSYVRAAYNFFDKTDADAIAEIDATLGKDYDESNAPAFGQDATVPEEGLDAAAFVLDAVPAIRFYLPDGADPAAYSFFIGDKALDTVLGEDSRGRYLEMKVYAYAMCERFDCAVNGESVGSYSVKSYYEFAKSTENTELIRLVERFQRYAESAKAYRESVAEQN